jgi:hypothetical protein
VAVASLAAGDAGAQSRPIERAGPGWIIDPAANCGTSNPFATGRETISWSGKCLRGRLHGPGTLIWFENGFETERDEGTFRNGEMHGDAVVTLANKTVIFGNYKDGVRHGEFMVVTPDGNYLQGIYADGELIEQRRLNRDEIKRWREARKGDQRLASITVEVPAREERPAAEPAMAAAAPPTPAAPAATAAVAAVPPAPVAALPAPTALAPTAVAAAVPAAPPLLPVRIPATPFIGPLGLSDPYTPLPFPVTAALSGATSVAALPFDPALAPLVRVDGRSVALATRIPGGINLAPDLVAGDAGPQFAETRILTSLLQPSPMLRAGAGPARPRSATPVQASQTQATRGVPLADEPIVLRPPGSAAPAGKLKLRPPPERSGAGFVPPAASTGEPAAAAPAPAPAAVPERRVALSLAGADIRDATKLILGDILNVRYSIDPAVRGAVSVGTPPDLATSMLVPWLRTALQANAADLVVTPQGYRVYALASAAAAAGTLPTLAPPPQAESQFVHAYALERDGRDAEAAPVYAALAANFPGSALATMAGERLAALNQRLDAPRRETRLPAQTSMVGAYLCSRRGYYPNQSKWCGFVRGEDGDALRVEVREIAYNGLLAIGFRATACTGGEFIGPTSHGKLVTVPRNCLEARW